MRWGLAEQQNGGHGDAEIYAGQHHVEIFQGAFTSPLLDITPNSQKEQHDLRPWSPASR